MIETEYLEAIILIEFNIGADEVGRGCFAGPIVGCAVKISSKDTKQYLTEVKDSKKLSAKKEKY